MGGRAGLGCLIVLGACLLVFFGLRYGVWYAFTSGNYQLREVEAMAPWFEEHRAELFEVRDLLLRHPAIGRVERPGEELAFRQYAEFTPADQAAYDRAAAKCAEWGIASINMWRGRDGDEFSSMDFTLWAEGFVTAGYSTKILFSPNESPFDWDWSPDHLQSLSEPGWYTYGERTL